MRRHGARSGLARLAAATAALTLVLAACTSESGESPAASAGGTDPTEAPPDNGSEPMTYEEICAAGAEEGALVYWHNHSEGILDVFEAFNEEHPDIEVELQELTPDDQAQRVLTESAAGRELSADILAGGVDIFIAVIDEGLADTETDWAAYGVPEDTILETGNLIRQHRIAFGLGYNTDAVTADDLPDTWEELIDEQWRGQVVVDPRGRPFDQLSLLWGEEQALDYVNRLKDVVQPLVIEGGTAGLVAVGGGEATITASGRDAETAEQQALGQPLDIKYMEAVPTNDNYRLILADAPHLNAARCYSIWFSTRGGQEIYNETEFKTNDTVPPSAPDGATVVTVDSPEEAEQVSELGREMGRIWTGQ